MAKSMFDPDALIAMFESATAQQGAQLRKAVSDATLAALQGRELSLKNIRTTLKSVADAAGAGAAKNILPNVDVQGLLDKAVSGMDDALLKAVDANRVALGKLVQQGADLREKHLKKALDDMEKFEDALMGTVRKAAESATGQLGAQWAPLLEKNARWRHAFWHAGHADRRTTAGPDADHRARYTRRKFARRASLGRELHRHGQRCVDRHVGCAAAGWGW